MTPHAGAGELGIGVVRDRAGKSAAFLGLQTCGSIWACPVCAAKIRAERAAEIEAALTEHVSRGGGVEFVTMTNRHKRCDTLGELLAACSDGLRHVQRDRTWREYRKGWGLRFIRSTEVTYTRENGWHAHIHLAILTDRPLGDDSRAALRDAVASSWIAFCVRRLGRAPSARHAVDWQTVTDPKALAAYLTKEQTDGWGVAAELARGDLKTGRRQSYHPFDLAVLGAEGQAWARKAWHEYERATKGRRAIEWSRGLRADLIPDWVYETDEEAAARVEETEHVGYLGRDDWSALKASGLRRALLDAVAEHGREGFEMVLDAAVAHARRLGWVPPSSARVQRTYERRDTRRLVGS